MKKEILLTAAILGTLASSSAFAMGSNIGYNNVSNGEYGFVLGSNNTAETGATSSLAFGDGNTVKQANSMAFGQGNLSDGENSFVGGDKAKAVGRDTFAFGSSAEALTEYTIAIGSQARTIGYNTLAIGNGATVSGPSSIAIGRTNNVTGENSVAIGANNGTIKGEQAVVVGYNNKMTTADQEQLIFGSNSVTSGQGSIVVGTHGQATAVDALALGNNTIADVQNGVAIGTNSVTDSAVGVSNIKDNTTDIRFSNSTYAGSTPDSVVSFGTNGRAGAGGVTSYTRQLQNVAAGRVSSTSTDAINGSQLYDVALEAQKYNTMADGSNTTVVATDNAYGRKEFKVNVNKDLVDMNSAAFGKNTDDKHTVVNTDGTIVFDGDKDTKYGANGLTIEDRNNLDTASYNINGMTASDANGTVSFTTTNIDAGNNQIHNVKTGTAGTDAVNVDQMNKAINDNRTIVKAGDNIVVKEDAGTYTVSTAKDLTNLNSVSLNDGNNESTYTTEGINMTYRGADDEYHTSYKYDGVHITTNDGDANPVNEVSLTDKGLNNGGNRITKVGKGIDGDDGVNVNQLRDELAKNKAVESVIADNQVDNIAAVRVTNGKSTGDANAQYGVYVSRSTVDAIAKASNRFAGDEVINVERWNGPANVADLTTFKYNGEKAATKTPLTYKANGKDAKQVMLANGLDFTNGKNTTATTDANGVVKYSVNDNLNGMKSVNFDGGTTVNNDGLTINNGPSVTKDGIDAGNKTITNVAPGRVEAGSTDAINGSQLNDAAQRISNRYDAAIANNQREISKVGARAAAMANLHYQDFNADDKWSFAAGYGHYKGQNAGAIGVAYQPNENTMITASTTIGKDAMYGAGVSMKFGKSSKMNTNKQVAMAKEIEELRAIVAAQNAKIDALVDHAMGRNEAITDVVFPDVPENHWAYMMVQDLAYKGIVVGYPDGNFSGDRTLTRYEFAVALDRAISAGYMSPELGRAIKEFKVELDQVQNGMRFRVDRVSGRDGATDKVERVRVNKDNTRDNYGTVVK